MDTNSQAVRTLFNTIAKARVLDVDMTVLTLLVLLAVAEDDGLLVADIIERTQSNKSSVSRILAILSDIGRRDKEGLGLVNAVEDRANRRYKRVYLTDKGKQTINQMRTTMARGCKKLVEG